jgi:hypothetical protein
MKTEKEMLDELLKGLKNPDEKKPDSTNKPDNIYGVNVGVYSPKNDKDKQKSNG